jgi:hypothetical protein
MRSMIAKTAGTPPSFAQVSVLGATCDPPCGLPLYLLESV